MEKEQIEEWRHLRDSALKTLQTGSHMQGIRLLHLLAMPTWEPAISYEIYETQAQRASPSYLLAIMRWRCDVDVAKFITPIERLRHPRTLVPTLESQSFEATAEFVNCILSKFKAISIPTLTDTKMVGLDGIAYEIELGGGFVWSRFHWWEKPPLEWQPLDEVFQDTLQKIERLIATKSYMDAG